MASSLTKEAGGDFQINRENINRMIRRLPTASSHSKPGGHGEEKDVVFREEQSILLKSPNGTIIARNLEGSRRKHIQGLRQN